MKVRYLDGVTSAEHLADLEIGHTGLRVHYVGSDGSLQEVYWPSETLLPTHLVAGRPVYLKRAGLTGDSIRFETAEEFARVAAAYPRSSLYAGGRNANQFTDGRQTSRIITVVALAFVAVLLVAYLVIESFGTLVTLVLPKSWDEKAGQALYQSLQKGQVKEDDKASKAAQKFFEATGFKSEYPIRIHVDRTKEVNAFALPGGQIIVNQGLIDKVKTPDELAGVLAHELGHVEKRHTFQQLARTGVLYILVSALVGDVSGIVAVVVDNGQAIFGLTYNRRMEEEADAFAVQQMLDQGLDPKGIARFFKVLEQEEKEHGNDAVPDILRTHPATPERIADIKAEIPARYTVDAEREKRLEDALKALQGLTSAPEKTGK